MDGPTCSQECITLDSTHPQAGERQIRHLCVSLLPGWAHLEESALKVEKMSGGISNLLVKVTPPVLHSQDGKQILLPVAVKVFGQKTELLIDRTAELDVLLQLNRAGFGAKVVAIFGNGRMEEFMNAYTLTPQDMSSPLFIPRIAQRLRQLHEVSMPGTDDGSGPGKPLLFETIQSWLRMARALSFEDSAKQKAFEQVDLEGMSTELEELQQLCVAAASPVVFSHNDLLSGNILVLQEPHVDTNQQSQVDLKGPLQFIDFEYSAPSYRGFDLGNHFNEYAGFDCDYSQYPGPATQALFLKHYTSTQPQLPPWEHGCKAASRTGKVDRESMGASRAQNGGNAAVTCTGTVATVLAPPLSGFEAEAHIKRGDGDQGNGCAMRTTPKLDTYSVTATAAQARSEGQQLQGMGSDEVSEDTLARLSAEANLFALASHAYWGIWALIQARYSPIDFDYFDYSGLRWAEYHRRKSQFVADAKRVLSI